MRKSKKGLLLAGSIMTVVVNVLAIIAAILLIWIGSKFTEAAIVEIFRAVPETYQYETNYFYQGVIYDYVIIDMAAGEIMLPETIEMTAGIFKTLFSILGFVILAFAGIKTLLAVIALAKSGKKFAKGAVITLIVFSFLTFSILEAALLIASVAIRDKKSEPTVQNNEPAPELVV